MAKFVRQNSLTINLDMITHVMHVGETMNVHVAGSNVPIRVPTSDINFWEAKFAERSVSDFIALKELGTVSWGNSDE